MNIKIRKATTDDLVTLQNLNQEAFIDNQKYDEDLVMDWALSDQGKKYFVGILDDLQCAVFIAEDNGRAVGYISASRKKVSYRKSSYCEIDNAGVIPEYQSQGVGRQMIDAIKKWAKDSGYDRLFVSSYYHNTRAVAFYKRNGFSEIDLSLETNL